ncbi:M1 family metallopeptidase [Sphingomonas sp. RB1R13]
MPRHYAVRITPDAAHLRFMGQVAIDLDIVQTTNSVTLNAKELAFGDVTIRGANGFARRGMPIIDAPHQTATLSFAAPLAPGRYRLDIGYGGVIHQQANGFFALDSKAPDGSPRRSLYTQFEAADARGFVPSWDEPDYKAYWDLSAIIPASQMAVGNLPAARTELLPGGLKRVTFATTPLMSSYLLFLGAGDFGRIATRVGNTEVAITMTKGNEIKARTALDAEAQVLSYYNDYFGTPYPLPKLENIAGPGQSQFFGAMENWGAIFTFERILLDDPAITSDRDRQAIFGVQAHEMAHQWFGDLVTMAWWDDLWLNEGFASWMASRTTEHFHPDWGADLDHVGARDAAFGVDAFATTHPIVQSVRTVEQANQAFDTITYEKGESVISMLEGFAGSAVWQKGIQAYVAKHQYSNTRTDDLWTAVETAGAPGLTRIAHDFTLQPGIPLLRVGPTTCLNGMSRVTLAQDQYSEDRNDKLTALTWRVPVRALTLGGNVMSAVTNGRMTSVSVPGCSPLLLNAGQTGYYRTLYQPVQIAALTKAYARLGAVDQYGLLTDNLALSRAGYQPVAVGLDLLAAVPADANKKLTGRALAQWGAIYDMYEGDPAHRAVVAAEIERRFAPLLARIGMAPRPGEPVLDATLRPTLIAELGTVGDTTVHAKARRLFASAATIPGSLKATWLGVIAKNADAGTWEQLHVLAKGASGAVERTTYYELLGAAKDDGLARRALDLALTDEPGPTVSSAMISTVAAEHPEMALDFALSHLDAVRKLVDTSGWSRFLAGLGSGSRKRATIDKLDVYAQANVAASDRKPIERVTGVIATRIAQLPRMKSETSAWLAGHAGRRS